MAHRPLRLLVSVALLSSTACAEQRIRIAPSATATQPPNAEQMVNAHNRWRAQVNVPPLTWSNQLQQQAQTWANRLKERNQCQMQHSPADGKTGENLFWASPVTHTYSNRPTQLTLQETDSNKVVDAWGSEVKDYDYSSNRCIAGEQCGHYTQMVWKSSTEVGCAKAICDDLSQVWVCNYAPAGNWRGEWPY
ncbi:MAG: CAP domain-containing protein [Gammaproteobacteria bacterium]|nr:CAP domain-containing protein [Gammaproteobacteria bacterium]